MRALPLLSLLPLLGVGCLGPDQPDYTPIRFAEGALHSITLLHGDRYYDDPNLESIDSASVWGLQYDVYSPGSIGLEVEWAQSDRAALTELAPRPIAQDLHELSAGARMTWVLEGEEIYPFAALGIVSLLSDRTERLPDQTLRKVSDEDWGAYLRVGLDYYVDLNLYVGLQLSWIQEEWFDPGGLDHDGFRLLMRLGWTY